MSISEHTVTAISAFSDNYIWAIGHKTNDHIVLVDPGDAAVCLEFIKARHLTLSAILITHHHPDHSGGISELKKYCQQQQQPINIYGPKNENIVGCTQPLSENDTIELVEIALTLKIIDLPGHTRGHIAYVNDELLFCGDTLFSGGCGRLFEGTAEQMHHSLAKLSNLPDKTKVYCAHEYTLANLNFALTVEPNNIELATYYRQVKQRRAQHQATIPTSIALEKKINPFLRVEQASIKQRVNEFFNTTAITAVETFALVRRWKDQF